MIKIYGTKQVPVASPYNKDLPDPAQVPLHAGASAGVEGKAPVRAVTPQKQSQTYGRAFPGQGAKCQAVPGGVSPQETAHASLIPFHRHHPSKGTLKSLVGPGHWRIREPVRAQTASHRPHQGWLGPVE